MISPTAPSSRKRPRPSAAPLDTAFRSLIRTGGLLRRIMEPHFQRFGITGAQWGVLRALWAAEEEGAAISRLADLSNRLLVRPPSVTTLIAKLERAGYIALAASGPDMRTKAVALTKTGRSLCHTIRASLQQHIAQVMSGLTEPEEVQLRDLLGKLCLHLEHLAEGQSSNSTEEGN